MFACFSVVFALVFSLYDLKFSAVAYSIVLCMFFSVVVFAFKFISFVKQHREREILIKNIILMDQDLPEPKTLAEKDYQKMINKLKEINFQTINKYEHQRAEGIDYYTTWVHQIKTPISVMQMILRENDTNENRQLLEQLFKIEQYVEMVLCYFRLDSSSSDFVIKEYDLDEIIKGFYPKLAVQSIRKNGKIYFPYIITCIGMVMMFYIITFLSSSHSIEHMAGGKDIQQILSFGVGVIAIFSVIFLFYSSSFVAKRRRKEFGLYNILGMGKRNIGKILVWENLIVYSITIILGLGVGIVFSKLAELFTSKMLNAKASLSFEISHEAVIYSIVLFAAGSISLCKLLQKNKKYYYKTNHFVSVSSMSYRMKRNGASLASICILSTMVLVTVSSTLCLYVGKEDYFEKRYPRDFVIETYSDDAKYFDDVKNAIDNELESNNFSGHDIIDYNFLPVGAYLNKDTFQLDLSKMSTSQKYDYSNIVQFYFMTIDDYNRLNNKSVELDNGEVLIYSDKTDFNKSHINLENFKQYQIKEKADEFLMNGESIMSTIPSIYVCVSDKNELKEIDKYQKKVYGDDSSKLENYYAFNLNCSKNQLVEINNKIENRISALQDKDENFPRVDSDCREKEKTKFFSLYSSLFMLGIIISIVFIFATVLIMYYKQITEGYEDADRFEIMQKVGMTKKEIKKSINSQVLTVFFAPLILAGVHICFAFPIVAELLTAFGITNKTLLILVTAGCFMAFALAYAIIYKLTAKMYFKIVSK